MIIIQTLGGNKKIHCEEEVLSIQSFRSKGFLKFPSFKRENKMSMGLGIWGKVLNVEWKWKDLERLWYLCPRSPQSSRKSILGSMTLPCQNLSYLNYLTIPLVLTPCTTQVAESRASFVCAILNLLGLFEPIKSFLLMFSRTVCFFFLLFPPSSLSRDCLLLY